MYIKKRPFQNISVLANLTHMKFPKLQIDTNSLTKKPYSDRFYLILMLKILFI